MPNPESECIFCKVIAGEIPSEVVDTDDHTLTVMDINPATRGHVVVMTRTHADNLLELSDEDLMAAMTTVRHVVHRMRDTLNPDGFNILHNIGEAAWQSIHHFHIHVIPRYKGDPLQLPWIPGPADPEELKRVADELRG